MTTEELENFFYDWATGVLGSGVPVTWMHQNADRPKTAYVVFHLSNEAPHGGMPYKAPPQTEDDVVTITLSEVRSQTLYTQAHGLNSRDLLSALLKSLSRPTVIAKFAKAGVAFYHKEGIHDLSRVFESTWEDRSALDLFFRFTESDTDEIGIIEKVGIGGVIHADSGRDYPVEITNVVNN